MDCIDLEARFPSFKVGYEDKQFICTRDPWHKVIECRHGHISPGGGSKLWACTKNRKTAAMKLLSGDYPCVIKNDGTDGVNAEFDVKDSAIFTNLMKAKRR